MKFKKEELQDCLYGDDSKFEIVKKQIVDHTRWSVHTEMILKEIETQKFFRVEYSQGATECQDEAPFEYESDEIECIEVFPKEVTITVYE